jgi:hypothetical protein
MEKITARLAEAGAAIGDRAKKAFANTPELFGTSEAKKKLAEAFDEIKAAAKKSGEEIKNAVKPLTQPKSTEPTDSISKPGADASRQISTADRLRQIGGYVTRGLETEKDRLAERTALASEKMVKFLEKIAAADKKQPTAATF